MADSALSALLATSGIGFWLRILRRIPVRKIIFLGAAASCTAAAAYALFVQGKPQRMAGLLSALEVFVPILNSCIPYIGPKIGATLSATVKL
jgi:hypothetical protein